ncbi:MAG: octanoyltransferase [Legionellales bacterium]|nr:octanoyltransferase [Legionellales bacterium]
MHNLVITDLGQQPYEKIWQDMKAYTDSRDESSLDKIWLVEHPPVFTQGQNGKAEHILNPGDIPIIQVDRGGQVTYHGPGQLVIYFLLDIRRRKLGVRTLVTALEQAVVEYLAQFDIKAAARCDAPGVYVGNQKVCSLGLRIRRGCSYHGLAFNVNMDLEPFRRINPCGLSNITMTQLKDLGGPAELADVAPALLTLLLQQLGIDEDNHDNITKSQ